MCALQSCRPCKSQFCLHLSQHCIDNRMTDATLYSRILHKHKIRNEVWIVSFFHALLCLQFAFSWKDSCVNHWFTQEKHEYPFSKTRFWIEKSAHSQDSRDLPPYSSPSKYCFAVTLHHSNSLALWWAVLAKNFSFWFTPSSTHTVPIMNGLE